MPNSHLIGASHGGTILGHPVTPGKRSPDGRLIEGVFTRAVVQAAVAELQARGVRADAVWTGPEHTGRVLYGRKYIPKWEFVNLVDRWERREGHRLHYTEVHTNAAGGSGWRSDVQGARVFQAKNSSEATRDLALGYWATVPPVQIRRSQQHILSRTTCPAVLLELMFHTNLDEVRDALRPLGWARYARAIVEGILAYEQA